MINSYKIQPIIFLHYTLKDDVSQPQKTTVKKTIISTHIIIIIWIFRIFLLHLTKQKNIPTNEKNNANTYSQRSTI